VKRLSTSSTYRWDDEIHRDDEAILLAKTTDEAHDDLVARVCDLHSDDVSCLERFDEDDALESFATWRAESRVALALEAQSVGHTSVAHRR